MRKLSHQHNKMNTIEVNNFENFDSDITTVAQIRADFLKHVLNSKHKCDL